MTKYFENYTVGAGLTTPGRTLTEADIVNFAGITGDWGEVHTNTEYAAETRFGGRVGHGALNFSISTGLVMRTDVIDEDGLIGFYGVDGLTFRHPSKVGDTLRAHTRVTDKERRDDDGIVTIEVGLRDQDDDEVASYEMRVLVETRRD